MEVKVTRKAFRKKERKKYLFSLFRLGLTEENNDVNYKMKRIQLSIYHSSTVLTLVLSWNFYMFRWHESTDVEED